MSDLLRNLAKYLTQPADSSGIMAARRMTASIPYVEYQKPSPYTITRNGQPTDTLTYRVPLDGRTDTEAERIGKIAGDDVRMEVRSQDNDLSEQDSLNSYGWFQKGHEPGYVGAVVYPAGNRKTRRHEMSHAMVHAARLGHEGLPLAHRAVAGIYGPHTPSTEWYLSKEDTYRQGLGYLADEVLARRVAGQPLNDFIGRYADDLRNRGYKRQARVFRAAESAQNAAEHPATRAALDSALITAGAYGLARPFLADRERREQTTPSIPAALLHQDRP